MHHTDPIPAPKRVFSLLEHIYNPLMALKDMKGLEKAQCMMDENLGLVKELCERHDHADQNPMAYLRADQIEILQNYLTYAEKYQEGEHKNASHDDKLKHLREIIIPGKAILNRIENARKIKALLDDKLFDIEDPKSEFREIEYKWRRRSRLANMSFETLIKLFIITDKLASYVSILKKDMENIKDKDAMDKIENAVTQINEAIREARQELAQAMLERILLLPASHLIDDRDRAKDESKTDDESVYYYDDVIFDTIESMAKKDFLSPENFTRLSNKAPQRATMTPAMIKHACSLITSYGSEDQKQALEVAYGNEIPLSQSGHIRKAIDINDEVNFSFVLLPKQEAPEKATAEVDQSKVDSILEASSSIFDSDDDVKISDDLGNIEELLQRATDIADHWLKKQEDKSIIMNESDDLDRQEKHDELSASVSLDASLTKSFVDARPIHHITRDAIAALKNSAHLHMSDDSFTACVIDELSNHIGSNTMQEINEARSISYATALAKIEYTEDGIEKQTFIKTIKLILDSNGKITEDIVKFAKVKSELLALLTYEHGRIVPDTRSHSIFTSYIKSNQKCKSINEAIHTLESLSDLRKMPDQIENMLNNPEIVQSRGYFGASTLESQLTAFYMHNYPKRYQQWEARRAIAQPIDVTLYNRQ